MSIADYSGQGLTGALAAVGAWIFRQHVKTDDDRYLQLTESIKGLGFKIDTVNNEAANRHTDLLNTLLLRKK